MHQTTSRDYSMMRELGVEIEEYGADEFMDQILNHEQIWENNLIEEFK